MQPTRIAVFHHLGNGGLLHNVIGTHFGLSLSLRTHGFIVSAHSATASRNVKAIILRNRCQIWWNFQIGSRLCGIVLNLVIGEIDAQSRTTTQSYKSGGKSHAQESFFHETSFVMKSWESRLTFPPSALANHQEHGL